MAKKAVLLVKLRDHLGVDPGTLMVLEQEFAKYERANLHFAIEELAAAADQSPMLVGVVNSHDYCDPSLATLSRPVSSSRYDEGPVEFVDEPLPGGRRVSCIKHGLYLLRMDAAPVVLLITEMKFGPRQGIKAEIMSTDRDRAEEFSARLTRLVRHGSAFRGSVLSLQRDCYGGMSVKFHSLPVIDREQVILPEEVLYRIERQTIAFSQHAERLAAAGRHLKRGILLHGPPGTGKTFTAMYLASQMPGRTVFLLTGAGLGAIETACAMARMLAPATIILEDVDLIGTQRDRQMVDANALLFELLNQMDGLAEDADILFVLTTNRPDVLEPALAARPGRIDQAIEVPPPDESCRRRLVQLYATGLTLNVADLDSMIRKLQGVSAAFIREALRKAAVFAAMDSDGEIVVEDRHLQQALSELLVAGGPLTQSLLGAKTLLATGG